MHQYIVSYLGGDQPSSPESGKAHFTKYQQWISSLGDAAIKPMVPFKNVHTVKPDGSAISGSAMKMSGQTILQAESIEAALELVKDCPFLTINGSLEVAQVVEMPN
jgi:hypothetical protein